ncbi:MAG: hypothetical protein JXR58_04885 [Bacteroidales bacterium]|nr:hypothetical protein [Bacteroidales bacterium]
MKKILTNLLFICCFVIFGFSQTADYQNCTFIRIHLEDKTQNITERDLTGGLMQIDGVEFCLVKFSSRELIVLIESDFEINKVEERLVKLGFTYQIKERQKYSAELFYEYYFSSNLLEQSGDSDVPKLNSRNTEKDNNNYNIIKSIRK